jgi:small-conductance mechanosensitive channel
MARFWIRLGLVLTPSILLAWIVGVVTLEFAVYHSLVYTLRIAVIAYFAYHIFELSTRAKWWYKLVQHAIAAGAILSLSIMLSELWLVERMGLIAMAQWAPIRHSLETTAITLFAGFIGWRYLDLWTEERLRAASGGLSPTQMDEEIAVEPASRLTTALPLVRVLSGVAILFFVAFLGMSQLGVDVTTLLAGAGVFGLALSFGSQALVRDIVSGVFFMSDDAFRVGEYIDTGRLKGTVERVTLRSVRLRHQNGQIHTIPFGQLNSISNFSRDWQTVKFNLRLARDTDIEKARKSVKRVGQELLQDPEFGKEFLLPLKLQGMAEITDSALVMRLKFTVKPTNPSIIQREALKRIHGAFAKDGIEFAAGVITVQPAGAPVLPAAAAAAATAAAATAAEAAAQPAA